MNRYRLRGTRSFAWPEPPDFDRELFGRIHSRLIHYLFTYG